MVMEVVSVINVRRGVGWGYKGLGHLRRSFLAATGLASAYLLHRPVLKLLPQIYQPLSYFSGI